MATSTKKAAKKAADKADESKATKADAAAGTSPANDPKANPASDPESHAVSASEMAALRPGGGEKASALAAADVDTAERMESETAERKADEDNSPHARLVRSGLVLNENQITGERWVGKSIQQTDADAASKNRTRVTPLSDVAPFRGLTVKPEGGEPFALGDEFDKDATPADWLRVINPGTKKSLVG